MQTNTKRFNTNDNFKNQQGRLVRATFKKAVIVAIHPTSNTADVSFAENPANIVRNVPLSSATNSALTMVGDKCRVDCFSETNTADMVVAYTYGRPPGSPVNFFSQNGEFGSGTSPLIIPHGLGVKPTVYAITPTTDWVFTVGSAKITYNIGVIADDTNLTLTMYPDNTENLGYSLFAATE